jgi:hypothetical protein
MKTLRYFLPLLFLVLAAPTHFAFAYGGGNGGGGDDASTGLRDSKTPPAGFEPTEKKGKTARSGRYGREQLTPEEEKEIVEKIGRQLTPEEKRTLEEMKSLNERAKKAFQEGDTKGAQTLRNWAISRWDDIPEIRDIMTLVPVDDMTEEDWAKSSQFPPAKKGSDEATLDPSKDIIAKGKITLIPSSGKTSNYQVDAAALQDGDTIIAGKNGATITWPNGYTIRLKPNTKIQIIQYLKHPDPCAIRVFYGDTWFKLNYNEQNKQFEALTPNASTGRRG